MITIGEDFIGIGRIVDTCEFYKDEFGNPKKTPVRQVEFGFCEHGFYIVKQTSLVNITFFKCINWIYLFIIAAFISTAGALIIFR